MYPNPAHTQVLIKTVSAGVNPVDLLVTSGAYKPEVFPKVVQGRGLPACRALPCQRWLRGRMLRGPQARAAPAAGPPSHAPPAPALASHRLQIIGGDVAGVVEEADAAGKVGGRP